MQNAEPLRTIAGAVLAGFGVTCGLALSPYFGGGAWLASAALVIAGFWVVARPLARRRR